ATAQPGVGAVRVAQAPSIAHALLGARVRRVGGGGARAADRPRMAPGRRRRIRRAAATPLEAVPRPAERGGVEHPDPGGDGARDGERRTRALGRVARMTTSQMPDTGQRPTATPGGTTTPPTPSSEPAPTPPKTVRLKRRVLGASSRLGLLNGIR